MVVSNRSRHCEAVAKNVKQLIFAARDVAQA
jgi:hypothetical protein